MGCDGRKVLLVLLVGVLALVGGCSSSPQEKREKFVGKGNELMGQGKYVQAVIEYRNAIQADPEDAETYFLAGQAELRQNKMQNAYAYFMMAVEKQPDHTQANLQLGRLLLGARQFDKALERVELVAAAEPDNQQAVLLRGGILLGEKKPKQAKEVFEKLLPRQDKEVDFYLLLATAYSQLGEGGAAEGLLKEGVARYPESIQLHIGLANLYLDLKQSGKVEDTLKQIIALEPDKASHVERLASFAWHEGRRDEAEALLKELLVKEQDSEKRWTEVAAFYGSRQERDKALQVLLEGLSYHPKSFALRFLLQENYQARGNLVKAMAVLQECLALDGDEADLVAAQRRLAGLHYQLGNVEEAAGLSDEILKKSPNDVDAHLIKAGILALKAEYDLAVAEYRIVLQQRPADGALYVRMADAMVRNHQNSLALDTLKQGLKAAPESLELRRGLTRLYLLESKLADAENELKKMVEQRPDDFGLLVELADFYRANGSAEKAEPLYRQVLEKAPGTPVGYLRLGGLQAEQGKEAEAAATLGAGLAALPDSKPLLEWGVQLYLKLGRPADALGLVKERLARRPDDVFGVNLQGNIYAVQKDYGAAERSFRRALELQPELAETAINLARILRLAGKADAALVEVEKLIDGGGAGSVSDYILLAELYRGKGDQAKGIEVLDRALVAYPDNWFIMNSLAYSLADGPEPAAASLEKAESLVRRALLFAPGNGALLDTLGWVSLKMGKVAQARAALTMALDRSPNNPVYNYHLGMVMVSEGKNDEAKSLLEKVALAPGNFSERDEAKLALERLAL